MELTMTKACLGVAVILCGTCVAADTAVIEGNMLKNPGFEDGKTAWNVWWNGYAIDETVAHTGKKSLVLTALPAEKEAVKNKPYGAFQTVVLNQQKPGPFVVGLWAKTSNLQILKKDIGDEGSWARLRLFITFQDETVICNETGKNNPVFFVTAPTMDWAYTERTFVFEKPVKSVACFIQLFHCAGTIWLDDLLFALE